MSDVQDRMCELMQPIDEQIMMCDNEKEIMMLACAMLQRVTEMLDPIMTVEGRRLLLKELT